MNKNAKILKSACDVSQEDMALIGKYTRRPLNADEVYTFSVVLCDNEIDRDFERFNKESLEKLKEMFVGKSGIFDHEPRAENQVARIYDTYVEEISGQTTMAGDTYCRLIAKAYIPVCDKTNDIIVMLDSGIQKEVSVGCAMGKSVCSVCGGENGDCQHRRGKSYNGQMCYFELSDPYDAYEWSFVAVPAQRGAGVIKSFEQEKSEIKSILKAYEDKQKGDNNGNIGDIVSIKEYIHKLEKLAVLGEQYRKSLVSEVQKLMIICEPKLDGKLIESVVQKLDITELESFKSAYQQKKADKRVVKPQLLQTNTDISCKDDVLFMI